MQADARQADPPDDDRGLARLLDEHPERGSACRMRRSALTFAPVPMMQPRTEPELAAVSVDEAELAERPQVAVDRRERHVEEGAELVGTDLATVGDRQQQAQPARERGVLGGFLGRSVSCGRHAGLTSRFSRGGNHLGECRW